jgi:hypothetical protein
MPLVLAVPAVWLVKRHTNELHLAEQVLQQEIRRLDEAIVEIADFDRTKRHFETRNAVLDALNADTALMLRLLNALGALPPGVQLSAVTASRGEVVVVGVGNEPAAVSAAVAALQAGGLDPVEIILRQPLHGTGPGEQFEIRARYADLSTRQGAAARGLPQRMARAERTTPP